jgi:hypothetical protein
MQFLAKRVSSKLEEGDYRGAVRIACSEDSIADITDESKILLQALTEFSNFVLQGDSEALLFWCYI